MTTQHANPVRFIGEKVRYYRCACGWMFGTVASVRVANGMELATVYFHPSTSRYTPYPAETVELPAIFLERCS